MATRERVTGVPFFIISDGKNKVTLSGECAWRRSLPQPAPAGLLERVAAGVE